MSDTSETTKEKSDIRIVKGSDLTLKKTLVSRRREDPSPRNPLNLVVWRVKINYSWMDTVPVTVAGVRVRGVPRANNGPPES